MSGVYRTLYMPTWMPLAVNRAFTFRWTSPRNGLAFRYCPDLPQELLDVLRDILRLLSLGP